MITREDAIKAGWEVNHHDTFDAYVFGNQYELWFHPTGEGITIDNLGSDEQVFEGNIPDYNALVLLMDWLGIKSSLPKINEQTGNNSYQDRGNTWFTFVLLPTLAMKGIKLDTDLREAWNELERSLR